MSANTYFLSDFICFKVSNIIIWNLRKYQNLSLPVWESININPIESSLKIKKKKKSDKNLIFADIDYFDLIYPSEKKRENSNRGQKMSAKICQKFLYCELTLESFGAPPRICATNSSPPPTDLKAKGSPDLPSVCSNYWPPIVALSLCFNHLVLSTFRQCRSAIPKRSAKPIASIHHTVEYP